MEGPNTDQKRTVLVTGGAGYIGSHTVVELLEDGYKVVVIDDLSNSDSEALERVKEICGLDPDGDELAFVEANILDRESVEKVFDEHPIDVIIHFAGFKAVGESVEKPIEYYWNNIAGSLVLFEVARDKGVKNIIFSSSATVYGEPDEVPISETFPKKPATNPYGQTKSMLEQILFDIYESDNDWNIVILRYFNPIGAHESGLIGEDPKGIPNNLLPYVSKVAIGELDHVRVFGDDYPTPDGTGIRDYIHVVDLAKGHLAAMDWMFANPDREEKVGVFNLGTGKGSSVLEVIDAFGRACGHEIPYEIMPRRKGDLAEVYATCDKAERELGWKAEHDLGKACEDSWNWQSKNPNGYRSS